jgi:hypothetical protein
MTNFSFTKIDVPAAAGTYTYIGVSGLDASGDAIGYYGNVDGDGDGTFHGFIALVNGNGITLDPPGSTNTSVGITASGVIFGDYTYLNHQYGFVDNGGVFTTFDNGIAEAAPPTVPLAISTDVDGVTNAGVIYGDYADYVINNGNQPGWQGFLNNNGVVTLIAFPGANITTLAGVNTAGTIVGNYEIGGNTSAGWIGHGFVDGNGSFTAIDVPGAYTTSVVGISDAGEIVGNYQDSSNNTYGFVDNNGVITKINIAGATSTGVSAVNAAGEVVGYYADGSGNIHGFTDSGGVITTVDVPGATETDILGVNAAGVISGYYNDSSGNQHGFVGTPPPATVIESFGSTSLVKVGNNYFLDSNSTGTGPELIYGSAPLTVGEFPWTPIGAEPISGGYEIALKYAAIGQYTIWITDSSGNVAYDPSGNLSGSSAALEAYETSFHQDLNGDGVIGVPPIESFGSTSLVQIGNDYFLDSISGGTGPELKYGGAPLTTALCGAWTPIGAEATATGYEVAFQVVGSSQYTVWNTDSSGNITNDTIGTVPANSTALEALEPSFHQDLNGDGVIGIPGTIESSGSTSLVQVGNNYFLDSNSTGTGPELIYGSAPLTAGEFPWTPIGAEPISGGYEIALKYAAIGQYTIWITDSNGNVAYDPSGNLSGNSTALETYETSFHQDLNGDGVIGIPATTTVIESSGSTSLVQVGNNYFLDSISTGTGPELIYGGAPLAAGEFPWTPIGAEQTSTGYEIALKYATIGQYTIWNTDSSGNVTYDPSGNLSGNSAALEAYETSFHQDLNGDGVIDSPTTFIEAKGDVLLTLNPLNQPAEIDAAATLELTGADSSFVEFLGPTGTLILDHSTQFIGQVLNLTGNGSLLSSDQLDLRDIGFGPGTTVGYAGTAVGGILTVSDAQNHTAHITLAGDYSSSTFTLSSDGNGGTTVVDPLVKQDTADGTLSFSDPDPTDTHSVGVSPQDGATGYLGSFVADAVNAANGQDTVGWHFNFGPGPVTQTVTQSYNVSVADHYADGTINTATQSVSVAIAGPGNDSFVFHPGVGSDTIVNAGSSDTIELDGFSSVASNNQLAALLHDAQTGQPQSLFQPVNGGHDTQINLGNHDSITLTGVHIADLHASDFIIH